MANDPKATLDVANHLQHRIYENNRINANIDGESAMAQIDVTGLVGLIETYCNVNISDLERLSIYIPQLSNLLQ